MEWWPKLGFLAVTDRKCGVNLRAISTFCTGLLTVFLNSEVTGLAGLTSCLYCGNNLGLSQGDHNGGVTVLLG